MREIRIEMTVAVPDGISPADLFFAIQELVESDYEGAITECVSLPACVTEVK